MNIVESSPCHSQFAREWQRCEHQKNPGKHEVIGDGEYPCDKMVLCSYTSYLSALFLS